jgi:hypothetical protein
MVQREEPEAERVAVDRRRRRSTRKPQAAEL